MARPLLAAPPLALLAVLLAPRATQARAAAPPPPPPGAKPPFLRSSRAGGGAAARVGRHSPAGPAGLLQLGEPTAPPLAWAANATRQLSAVIVEARCHPGLPLVIANLHARLPHVPVQLFYAAVNEEFAGQVLEAMAGLFPPLGGTVGEGGTPSVPWLTLSPLPARFYHEVLQPSQYSALLESSAFWDLIPTEKVLIFQTDSWICKDAERKLQKFIQYDYIGAPWAHDVQGCLGVGNGGLSLRSRSKMRSSSEPGYSPWAPLPEDVYFCQKLVTAGDNVAPANFARQYFNEESIDVANNPFGVHKPWVVVQAPVWTALIPSCAGLTLMYDATHTGSSCSAEPAAQMRFFNEYRNEAIREISEAIEGSTAPL